MSTQETINFLLVDDLDENLVTLEALLARDGLTCLKARSGEEALELLLSHEVALALLDVQMPGMDGFELAEFMRGSERTRHVPIIFLTAGTADQQRRFRGYEAGAVDFLQKPIESDILRSKASVFFDLHDQKRQITAQRDALAAMTAELRAADQQKNRFLAVLAHELRNPAMALGAGLSLTQRRKDPEFTGMVHAQMARQVRQLTRLIEDLLDIARIDRNKISLNKKRIQLQEVVQFAIEGTQHLIDAAEHRLRVDSPADPIWIHADEARLAQIFGNLLSNAAKYTPPGGEITLSVRRTDAEVEVEVKDTGVGIPPEMQPKIFEMFAQVENGHGHSHYGLGIGLALVQQLVELHGGSIALASSQPGEGSMFRVRLPAGTA